MVGVPVRDHHDADVPGPNAERIELLVQMSRVQIAPEGADARVDEHHPAGRLDQQRREATVEFALGVQVRPHERPLHVVVVAPEHEPRGDGPAAVHQHVAARSRPHPIVGPRT